MYVGDWAPFHLNTQNFTLSHIMFADDIVLIARIKPKNANTIVIVLNLFAQESSLKANLEESTILFSQNVSN